MMKDKKLAIKIMGREYEIHGNPKHLRYYKPLAKCVENKMLQVFKSNNIVSNSKIATLTAFHFADMVFQGQESKITEHNMEN